MDPDKANEAHEERAPHEQWRGFKEKSSKSRNVPVEENREEIGEESIDLSSIRRLTHQERSIVTHDPGRSEPNQSVRLAQQDKIWYTGRLSDQLGLFEQQKREAQELMIHLNLDKFGNQKRLEKIALLVIRYIVERDRNRNNEEYWRITKDRRYLQLMDEYDMDKGDLMRLGPKVTEEIKKLRS